MEGRVRSGAYSAAHMSGTELLSILVPVYNEVRTVAAVIDRLLTIDLPVSREILVVNDGLTDGTTEILDGLTRRGDALQVLHPPANAVNSAGIWLGLSRPGTTVVSAAHLAEIRALIARLW
jgi:cellulose synthase/poly-beta-1,6-N-acetylglucosamine synthase-like glycosyltransferase